MSDLISPPEIFTTILEKHSLIDYLFYFQIITISLPVIIAIIILYRYEYSWYEDFNENWYDELKNCRHQNLIIPPVLENYTYRNSNTEKRKSKIFSSLKQKIIGEKDFFESDKYYFNYNKRKNRTNTIKNENELTPLLCFINSESGGNQGKRIISMLKKLLNPIQVFDLKKKNADPYKCLIKFSCFLPNLKILVAGGDGTVSWILSLISKLDNSLPKPAVAVLPLGTGNDLAGYLGWGNTTSGLISEISQLLFKIDSSSRVEILDQWKITVKNNKTENSYIFNNYCGIGVDAEVVSTFHENREKEKHIRKSTQIRNKFLYGIYGLREIFNRSHANFRDRVTIFANNQEIELPETAEGVIFSNIKSFAGGSRLWYDDNNYSTSAKLITKKSKNNIYKGPNFVMESSQDGYLECVAVEGALHLAEIKAGLRKSIRLVQASSFEIRIDKDSMPFEYDGEPVRVYNMGTSYIYIDRIEPALMLRCVDYDDNSQDKFLDCINWGVKYKIITSKAREQLLQEYSRRHCQ